ncbi:GNAT family N-acetyltransferase [Pseudomonas sp. AN3A02]|nr:GNAT family N-acetyltransferase [Pseudomonas sp. SED1]MDY0832010.1 GNAT family N-acetyltransferase [Pseudomonas sp. SED1]NIL16311.1 GNAT family N-acetyltransferase [Pseudomonas sp. AN3A02]
MIHTTRDFSIRTLSALTEELLTLEAEAIAEGFRFLTRLIAEWKSGANRFDRPGECLLGVFNNGQLIAIGGLSYDPYAGTEVGRLRRVYVAQASRGCHVGKALVSQLLKHAAQQFGVVRLSTDTQEGAAFYLRCGFEPVQDKHATHAKSLIDQEA